MAEKEALRILEMFQMHAEQHKKYVDESINLLTVETGEALAMVLPYLFKTIKNGKTGDLIGYLEATITNMEARQSFMGAEIVRFIKEGFDDFSKAPSSTKPQKS